MKTIRVDRDQPSAAAIGEAAEVILHGGLVGFPTETVYGLGANALDRDAVARIFAAKERPHHNPLIVHCADATAARRFTREWSNAAERIASTFWPGPLTIVVPKSAAIPDEVTAGLPTVALRVPSNPVAHALLSAAGVPIAAPSANRFAELSPTTAEHVGKGLADRIDLLLDAGPTRIGIESTVIDLSTSEPILLRPGSIDVGHLESVLGRGLGSPSSYPETASRPAPGMLERHYSPRATLKIVPAGDPDRLRALLDHSAQQGARVGALLRTIEPMSEIQETVRMPVEPVDYARALYAALHELDDAGCDLILVEAVPDAPAWAGVRDRLARAAG